MSLIPNPRSILLRDPNLFTPGKKPVGKVQIDWSHPITKNLVAAWIFQDKRYWDLTGRYPGVQAGTGTDLLLEPTEHGMSIENVADNADIRIDLGSITSADRLSFASSQTMSFYSYCEIPSTRNNNFARLIDKSNGSSAANGYAIYIDNVDRFTLQIPSVTPRFIITDGVTSGLGISAKSGNQRFFENGIQQSSASDSYTISSTSTSAALLNWNHSTDRQWNGKVYCIYLWDRFLSDEDHFEINRDRYQFLIPA